MKIQNYSHLCKDNEWSKEKVTGVLNIIQSIDIKIQRNCAAELREIILDELNKVGWSSLVKVSYGYQISITATNGELGLCLQTGNMSRFYADLLKIQYLYNKRSINSAIYILPSKKVAIKMGSNLANFERFVSELKLFAEIITIPIYVIGID